ncbi:MAG: type II toxin-antitoxin system VapC family toxin [Planctomycetes bacterium]|nr:type II toxin-antitoxin system VapC family toxin [Planctomycetota bacterium]
MRLFLDSSALAKRYVREVGTDRVVALCTEADEVIVSVIALPEVVSTLNRLRREGRLTESEYATMKQEVVDDLTEAITMDVSPSIVEKALVRLERSPLRASDALHIASAQEAGPDLFLTGDRRQRGGASDAGLRVEGVGI